MRPTLSMASPAAATNRNSVVARAAGAGRGRVAAAPRFMPLSRCNSQQQQQQQQQPQRHRRRHDCRRSDLCRTAAAAGSSPPSPPTAAAAAEPTVEEVMNPRPVLLSADMPIKDAVHTLLQADVSGAPVVDASGALVGVLTESDIVWKGAGAPEDHFIVPPVFVGFAEATIWLRDNAKFHEESRKILARTVSEAMTAAAAKSKRGGKGGGDKGVVWVAPGAGMSEAARAMVHHNVNLLPVVEGGEGGKVVGVVTRHDVMRALYASGSPFLK